MVPQVWLITGSSSGFGAGFVKDLLKRGDKVIATARNVSTIASFKEAGASVLQLDITDPIPEIEKKVKEAINIYGHIDVVVNNAGYSHFGTFEDATEQDWSAQFNTNFFGHVNVTRAILPHLRSRKSGTLVFIGSAAAELGGPALSLYCATKAALTLTVQSLREEVKMFNIRTMVVQPGFFRTELLNPKNTTYIDTKIEDYKPLVDSVYTMFKGANGQQTGDPDKGATAVVDVVKGEGLAAGKDFPATLVLGSDCVAGFRNK